MGNALDLPSLAVLQGCSCLLSGMPKTKGGELPRLASACPRIEADAIRLAGSRKSYQWEHPNTRA